MLTELLTVLSLTGPRPCAALMCSCVLPGPIGSARNGDETVFEGRVLQERDTTIWRAEGPRLIHLRTRWRVFTLNVERVWNGAPTDTIEILTGFGGGDCGYPFVEGEQYVVFARPDNSVPPTARRLLIADICSHTTAAKNASVVRDSLGVPVKQPSPSQ
jgi:hypothetical protein